MTRAAATVFTLPPLPYTENALEPVISAKTLRLHHGKHNKGYVDTLNELKGWEQGERMRDGCVALSNLQSAW
ncbi:MAG TPA: hypothetical protein VNX02_10790 [Steroidobacteraceae bacterium]|nr:hypothetical protein [Steroidobacteraceae bacterium]